MDSTNKVKLIKDAEQAYNLIGLIVSLNQDFFINAGKKLSGMIKPKNKFYFSLKSGNYLSIANDYLLHFKRYTISMSLYLL